MHEVMVDESRVPTKGDVDDKVIEAVARDVADDWVLEMRRAGFVRAVDRAEMAVEREVRRALARATGAHELSDDWKLLWANFLPGEATYGSDYSAGVYDSDTPPMECLRTMKSAHESGLYDRVVVRYPSERVLQSHRNRNRPLKTDYFDPAAFGVIGGRWYLLCRWAESAEGFLSERRLVGRAARNGAYVRGFESMTTVAAWAAFVSVLVLAVSLGISYDWGTLWGMFPMVLAAPVWAILVKRVLAFSGLSRRLALSYCSDRLIDD